MRRSDTLSNLGYVHLSLSELLKAAGYYEEALKLAREIRNLRREGIVLSSLGVLHQRRREPEGA